LFIFHVKPLKDEFQHTKHALSTWNIQLTVHCIQDL